MPLSWIMGVPWEHCETVGTLIGLKTVVNELVAYKKMGEFKNLGQLSGRSEAIATFAICGFANPGSIGIQIGIFSSLAPEKKEQITDVIVRAFVTGCAVCFLTASIAGKSRFILWLLCISFPFIFCSILYHRILFHFILGMLIDDASLPSANATAISNITSTTPTSLNII